MGNSSHAVQRQEAEPIRCAAEASSSKTEPEQEAIKSHQTVRLSRAVDVSYSLADNAIGHGAFGSVSKATHKLTQVERAVKVVAKSSEKFVKAARDEIDVLSGMDHPNIMKLHEVWEGPESFHLVMELCSGGELFERVVEAGQFSEMQAAVAMQQLLRAISYMHNMRVCHRDIKPENLMFQNHAPVESNQLKIIDFGYATRFTPGEFLTRKVGTPSYVDPEILDGLYTEACDAWGAGVIMYIMLSGSPPFYGDSNAEVLSMVREASVSFDLAAIQRVSRHAQRMIRGLLTRSSAHRCAAKKALEDRWLRNNVPAARREAQSANGILERLQQFHAAGRLKQVALHVIASQLGEEHTRRLQETFVVLDQNCDGLLCPGELKKGLGLGDVGGEDVLGTSEAAYSMLDYTGFLAATIDERVTRREDVCRSAFSALDRDGDGRLSREELQWALSRGGKGDPSQHWGEAMKEVNENGDGMIDFAEFMKMMRGASGRTSCSTALGRRRGRAASGRGQPHPVPVPPASHSSPS